MIISTKAVPEVNPRAPDKTLRRFLRSSAEGGRFRGSLIVCFFCTFFITAVYKGNRQLLGLVNNYRCFINSVSYS